jgi:YHS domain-containing protein
MAKDPICGMDVNENETSHLLHDEHKTIYFCSGQCKEKYARDNGMKNVHRKKGFFSRFLEKLAKDNKETFGGSPPTCH